MQSLSDFSRILPSGNPVMDETGYPISTSEAETLEILFCTTLKAHLPRLC